MISGWWVTKVACGLLLAGHAIATTIGLYSLGSTVTIPLLAAQISVILGAAITLWHYSILGTLSGKISQPTLLVVDRGLFAVTRHPMYLGDLILYVGLAMITADSIAWGLASIGVVAIIGQCKVEDRVMSEKFGDQHRAWKRRTCMLVPWLL